MNYNATRDVSANDMESLLPSLLQAWTKLYASPGLTSIDFHAEVVEAAIWAELRRPHDSARAEGWQAI